MRHIRGKLIGVVVLLASATSAVQGQGRGRGRGNDKPDKPDKHEAAGRVVVVAPVEQQRRIVIERERTERYRENYGQQVKALRAEENALAAARRAEAVRAQQEYAAARQRELRELQAQRDYERDRYISTPHVYRYVVSGAPRETNQYGVDVLRGAVNNGYSLGYRAGLADRRDRWRDDYRATEAYRDATYGYRGAYVDQADYSYYFRQGYQRGYEDGYSARFQYGTYSNGSYSVLGNVLNSILGLVTIR